MLGDALLPMPTDLHSTRAIHTFEVEQHSLSKRKGITRLTVEIPTSSSSKTQQKFSTQPSRWRTPEFMLYGVVFAIVIPMMCWIPIQLSSTSHKNHGLYSSRLSQGWLFGRQVDVSDAQYRSFRNNLPILSALVLVFLALKQLYLLVLQQAAPAQRTDRLHLVPFLLTFSLVMLTALHGTSILKMAVILSLNYAIAKSCRGSKLAPLLAWVFNGGVLFANEWGEGYRFGNIHPGLQSWDHWEGIYPRWHIIFNITMLRLVSFNMDYYWACNGTRTAETGQALAYKQRISVAHPLELYSFHNYLAYIVYPPLYIGGPIITFNDFIWQLRRPLQIPLRDTLGYLARFAICTLTMEFILHYMYMVAIKDTKAWYGDTVGELSMIGFWNLIIVWLKLLIPWRFFRLWALLDGIDPPENMVRCMANNYSALGFWRSWHRSYNLWIVRYIYIPLGGTKNSIFTTVLIFSFVALWHDLSFTLLAWGWLVSLFILPEIAARYLLPSSKYESRPWYRHLCAIGAVFNILMMMTANLVGFVVGTDGITYLLSRIFSGWEGISFMCFTCSCLFVGVQVMFEYREEEMRRGIYRRC
ncbi:MBOAT, membrane-bound O-acyltransferase family-domain-containing protein [Irpex rosettiformis]|uniref:MBOAT, membrane-bound O-acyltransferase family-domain-containing protein n=1 Tax=Irpex rosettiformis TaxID=378272 RepID=A0ACB8UAQ5_9APHY|nr:MBOAT, membrane-bound O-acyltransferase family-domain-containing protein [Irpex rosettiformis]